MPIDFPNSPSVNDEFTSGSTTWRWDGTVWKVIRDFAPAGATGPIGPTGAIGNTGPTGITGINWRAAFDFVAYSVGDAVQYSGSAYYCNTAISSGDISSHIPGSSARWDLLSAKGSTGVTGVAGAILAINNDTGTSYTLQSTDLNDLVTLNNANAITVTVPPSVFSPNDVINIVQTGVGQVTFVQGSGVTITSTGATVSAPKLRAQYSAASVVCTASNTFLVIGDVT